MLIEFKFI